MVLGLCSFAFHSSFFDYEQSLAPQQSIKAEIVLKYLTVLRPRQCLEEGGSGLSLRLLHPSGTVSLSLFFPGALGLFTHTSTSLHYSVLGYFSRMCELTLG